MYYFQRAIYANALRCLFLFVAASASLPVWGAVLHVSTEGSDSGRCTEGSPCRTIAHAALLANPGDTVRVSPGEYAERVAIKRSGSKEQGWITFEGHAGSGCGGVGVHDINSRGARPLPQVVMQGFAIDASYIKIDCFEITGTNQSGVKIGQSQSFVSVEELYVHDGPGAVVEMARVELPLMARNVTISRNYGTRTSYGFIIFCRDECLIDYNEVERNVTTSGADLDYSRLFGEGITFRRNYFHGNSLSDCVGCHIDCFQTWDIGQNVWEVARRVVIDGNVCFNAHQGIIARSTVGGPVDKLRDWTVVNNVFRYGPIGSTMGYCALFEHVGNVLFAHNLCGGPPVSYRRGSDGRHANNIHYLASWQPYSVETESIILRERNVLFSVSQVYKTSLYDLVNMDPLVINATLDDYRLQSNSPLIDMGVNLDIKEDHNGNPRVSGRAPDIGPYEVMQEERPTVQPQQRRR